MAEEKKTGEKKHITGARIAKEIRQYKKDALLSPMYPSSTRASPWATWSTSRRSVR